MSKRSRRGGGTVFFDENRGRYVGQLSYFGAAGERRRPKVYAATEAECWDKLDELRAELKSTGTVAPRDTTVATAIRDVMTHPPAEWTSPITRQVYRDSAARITAALGNIRLAMLTVSQVENFLSSMMAAGYGRETITRSLSLLRRALRRAQRDGLVVRNVAELAEHPGGVRRRSHAMTPEQVRALLAMDLNAWWHAYVTCGVFCGLRPGELLGLRWEDVDFDAGLIRVRKCLKTPPARTAKGAAC